MNIGKGFKFSKTDKGFESSKLWTEHNIRHKVVISGQIVKLKVFSSMHQISISN